MLYHITRRTDTSFWIQPQYKTPHSVYQFGSLGCDLSAITDHFAALTVAYMEWFCANQSQESFAEIARRAQAFFQRKISPRTLIQIFFKQQRSGVADEDEIPEKAGHPRFIHQILAKALSADRFPSLWFAWVGAEMPFVNLPPRNGCFLDDLSLETATTLTVTINEEILFDVLRPEDLEKLDVRATKEQFGQLLSPIIRQLMCETEPIEVGNVVVDFQPGRPSHLSLGAIWFPFPIESDDLIKQACTRIRPMSWYVFCTPESHARAMIRYQVDLLNDLIDTYGLPWIEAFSIIQESLCVEALVNDMDDEFIRDRYRQITQKLRLMEMGVEQEVSSELDQLICFIATQIIFMEHILSSRNKPLTLMQRETDAFLARRENQKPNFIKELGIIFTYLLLHDVPLVTLKDIKYCMKTSRWSQLDALGPVFSSIEEIRLIYGYMTAGGQALMRTLLDGVILARSNNKTIGEQMQQEKLPELESNFVC